MSCIYQSNYSKYKQVQAILVLYTEYKKISNATEESMKYVKTFIKSNIMSRDQTYSKGGCNFTLF